MQNFQNDLQTLGMDGYRIGEVMPIDSSYSYQSLEDSRRCGRCGGGMRCGGMRCGGFRCGGFRCGGFSCGGFRCGGFRCGGCFSCYGGSYF